MTQKKILILLSSQTPNRSQSLKLALAISSNENFDLISGDINYVFFLSRNVVTKKSLFWSTGRLLSVLFGTEKEVEELGMRFLFHPREIVLKYLNLNEEKSDVLLWSFFGSPS